MTVLKPTPQSLFQINPRKFTTDSTGDQIYSPLEANPLSKVHMSTSANFGTLKIPGRMTFTPQFFVSKSPSVSELKRSTAMTDGFRYVKKINELSQMSRKSMGNIEQRLSMIRESQSPDSNSKHNSHSPMIHMYSPDGIGRELTSPP
jgi:hypothetical protein